MMIPTRRVGNRQTRKTPSISAHHLLSTTPLEDDGWNISAPTTTSDAGIQRRKGYLRHGVFVWIGLSLAVGLVATTTIVDHASNGTLRQIQSEVLMSYYDPRWLMAAQKERPRQRRLEFIHIPKTGGTVIEKVAGKHGVAWTICHFMTPQAVARMSGNIVHCPSSSSSSSSSLWSDNADLSERQHLDWMKVPRFHDLVWWHLPPSYFFEYRGVLLPDQNPYQDVDLFTVVRDPYDRLLSEYYYQQTYLVSDNERKQTQDVRYMNRWVTTNLKAYMKTSCNKSAKRDLSLNATATKAYLRKDGHFIPQYDFVYNTAGVRSMSTSSSSNPPKLVKHVLKFETLRKDFNALMYQYGLDELVPLPHEIVRKSLDKKLGLYNLTLANLQLIEQVYAKDFEEFNYPIRSPIIPVDILNRNAMLVRCGSSSSVA